MAGVAPLLSPGGRLVARGPPPPRRVRPGRRCGEGSAPHDPAAALSELDNALDIIAGNLQPGIGDAQGLARWRGQQRSIQAVRDQLAEAAAPRQRPATRPGVTAAATPGRAGAAGVTLLSPPDGRPWTPRSSGRIIPSRFTFAQWGNQALYEFRAGRGDAALAAVDNAAALDPDHRDR